MKHKVRVYKFARELLRGPDGWIHGIVIGRLVIIWDTPLDKG